MNNPRIYLNANLAGLIPAHEVPIFALFCLDVYKANDNGRIYAARSHALDATQPCK